MKLYLPNESKSVGVGGGWTFRNNLIKFAPEGLEIVEKEDEAKVALISGVTMVGKDTFRRLCKKMKMVVRIDGIPEPWRNPKIEVFRRLKDWCNEADGVVYQSGFTEKTIGRFIGKEGRVILNGVDTTIFKDVGERELFRGRERVLYVFWRKDPNKRPEEVIERFRYAYLQNKDLHLVWVGTTPSAWRGYNLGLFDDTSFTFISGPVTPKALAKIMRGCHEFWFPSYADPCPNVLIEALQCGLEPRFIAKRGGASEIVFNYFSNKKDFSAKRMAQQYFDYLKEIV